MINASGIRSSLALALVALAACRKHHAQAETTDAARPARWIVAADLSASRNQSQLEDAKNFVASIFGVAHNGDELSLMRVYEHGLADPNFLWTDTIPGSADSDNQSESAKLDLEDAKNALRAELTVLFDPNIEGKLKETDLLSTLARVDNIVHGGSPRRTTLFLLSDMLQSTKELNMERSVPDSTWVLARAAQHRIPDLSGICVVAVGPDPTTGRGQRVLAFWRAYFRAAHADFRDSNYRNWAPNASQLGCS